MSEGTKNTDDIKAKVKELYLDGVSASLIAQALWDDLGVHKTRNAVLGIVYRMGLSGTAPSLRPRIAKNNPGTTGKKLGPRRKEAVSEIPTHGEPRLKPVELFPALPPLVEVAAMPVPQGAVLLADITDRDCHFIVSQGPARYCARPVAFGTPYCVACARTVYSAEGLERLAKPRPSLRRVA